MRALMLALLLGYAVLVHFAISTGQARPALITLGLLLIVAVGGIWRRLLVAAVMAGIVWEAGSGRAATWLLYLPPVMVYLALAALFGSTLKVGSTPLVTRIATMMDGDLSPKAAAYTRGVTAAWTAFLILLALVSAGLAALADVEIWSLFSNLLSYLALGLFMLAEYAVRRRVLRDEVPKGFANFIRRLMKLDVRQLLRGVKP